MNNKLNDLIALEEWKAFTPENREWLTFNFLQKVDNRLKRLERRKRIDTGMAAITGVFGGFIAFFISKVKFGG